MLKNKLLNKGILSKRLLEMGVFSFDQLIALIQNLPYGRNADRANPDLVLKELKGACSTKHALIKKIALEQEINEVKLILCMFKMNAKNTSKIAKVLYKYNLEYIPEAHCVLQIKNQYLDITTSKSSYNKIKEDVIELVEIQPEQIGVFKVEYHQQFLKTWLNNNNYSFEELWKIREECIEALS
ncbi:hypothetical protein [Pseudofulvibacter geojedonensis]|uniref:Uncharacterized protein n=1 Tax=Pseudofulvibacter geojedonensis TaxID=1123758 RepID=A0ABW3I4G0_9FLAO